MADKVKLGIIGYGHIGTQLGILAESLGMYVYFYDIENKLPLGNATQVQHLSDLLNMSDVVSLPMAYGLIVSFISLSSSSKAMGSL